LKIISFLSIFFVHLFFERDTKMIYPFSIGHSHSRPNTPPKLSSLCVNGASFQLISRPVFVKTRVLLPIIPAKISPERAPQSPLDERRPKSANLLGRLSPVLPGIRLKSPSSQFDKMPGLYPKQPSFQPLTGIDETEEESEIEDEFPKPVSVTLWQFRVNCQAHYPNVYKKPSKTLATGRILETIYESSVLGNFREV
jgi:hypothetical protein